MHSFLHYGSTPWPAWCLSLTRFGIYMFGEDCVELSLCKKATIHQVTTMLGTSKNALFPGHNHLLTTGADDLTLQLSPKCQRGLAGGYDLEIGHF